jgi:hypothetical protein
VTRPHRTAALLVVLCVGWPAAWAAVGEQLVFGSFRDQHNAARWATELTVEFAREIQVERVHRDDGVWYRVRTGMLTADERAGLETVAADRGLGAWVIRGSYEHPATVTSSAAAPAAVTAPISRDAGAADSTSSSAIESRPLEARTEPPEARVYADFDVGVQTRTYPRRGLDGQGRFQPSVSARLEYHRAWDEDRSSVTFTPFLRLDADDDERTHGDLRELFWTRVGSDWEIHVGARQIFWGVTEFNHLVDIINQTDLVENIDGEDKLGQPMVQLSLVRDWGILDLFALTGSRERTFPGEHGRLRGPLPVDTDAARYGSAAGRGRIDGAVRWSHHLGPVSFGLYQFSGTSRDPRFVPELRDGTPVLVPEYHVIDQTGLDAQAIFGDWAWKLETLTRSGHGNRYYAYTAGFERTLVGVLGSRGDLGLVVEYMYDQRDEEAFDTLFEHDLAFGTRWLANDVADTTALAGIIWDVDTNEYVLSVEASRRLGPSWLAVLEGRVFGGGGTPDAGPGAPALLNGEFKSRSLQDDDFVQLELTRYF